MMADGTEAATLAAPGSPLEQMPAVLVKNTFLDLDDAPRMPELQRWRSAPAPERPADDSDDDQEESEAAPEEQEDDGAPPPLPDLYRTKTCDGYEPVGQWDWSTFGSQPGLDIDLGPPNPGLMGGGDFMAGPGTEPALEPGSNDAPPMPMPLLEGPPPMMGPGGMPMMPPQAFGVVMVPADAVPPGAIPFNPAAMPPPPCVMPGMPPGCMVVPVERFTRWPDGMPGGPSAPVPVLGDGGQLPPPGPPAPAMNPAPAAVQDSPPPETASGSGSPTAPGGQGSSPSAPAGDAAGSSFGGLAPPAPPRAPVLQRTFSVPHSCDRIRWTVDARKLKGTDREAVSPMFELSFSRMVNFKILIRPKVTANVRGGASFKKAKGKGSVELRCLDEVTAGMNPTVRFRISVGSSAARQEPPRGPVTHDFTKKAICGLPPGQEEWDFSKAVDEATQTFVVCLEIFAGPTGPQ